MLPYLKNDLARIDDELETLFGLKSLESGPIKQPIYGKIARKIDRGYLVGLDEGGPNHDGLHHTNGCYKRSRMLLKLLRSVNRIGNRN